MKKYVVFAAMLFSVTVAASEQIECAHTPYEIQEQISLTKNCGQAAQVAEACLAGSSMDGPITGAAIVKCDKDIGSLSKTDKKLRRDMEARCDKRCNLKTDGTICISMIGACKLSVAKFFAIDSAPESALED